jgi:mannose-6-phosphate isomerase-like protein (cupin superfamily)
LDFVDKPTQDFAFHSIFDGRTASLSRLESHFSILQGGKTPHPPHHHTDEEIIVLLSGSLMVIREDVAAPGQWKEEQMGPGELVYHASDDVHTLRAVGTEPAKYLVLKWRGGTEPTPNKKVMPSATITYAPAFAPHEQSSEGFATTPIFEGPTRYLRKLHCHVSTVRPGAGYDPHDDGYDVAIVLLEGIVETVGQRVEAPSAIFYSADHPHGLRNVGDTPAQYVVFEFHGLLGL